jgi:hypothetical protein
MKEMQVKSKDEEFELLNCTLAGSYHYSGWGSTWCESEGGVGYVLY